MFVLLCKETQEKLCTREYVSAPLRGLVFLSVCLSICVRKKTAYTAKLSLFVSVFVCVSAFTKETMNRNVHGRVRLFVFVAGSLSM